MEFPESLQLIAEVGIGLAGFSGLIVALRKSGGPLEDIHKFRLRVLLSSFKSWTYQTVPHTC